MLYNSIPVTEKNFSVAIDNRVIREQVWPLFVRGVPPHLRLLLGWKGNEFDADVRFMTTILMWANTKGWTTTDLEAIIIYK